MSQPTVLLVDDDPEIISMIKEFLHGRYIVDSATDPLEGIRKAENLPELILLDVDMPKMNGLEVFENIRHNLKSKNIPVLFLTAEAGVSTIQKALGMGAADYLLKPFRPKELLDRIQMRLKQAAHQLPMKCGNLIADPATFSIRIKAEGREERLFLSKKAFLVLQAFLRNEGSLLTREHILSEVWSGEDVTDRAVDLQIFRLRKKLHGWNRKILALYERGYVLTKV